MNLKGNISQLKNEEIINIFKPVEGEICFYYGKTRNGKTYGATADILNLLSRGEIVVANWEVKFDGYDERNSFFHALLKFFIGYKYFFKYKPENFIYFSPLTPADEVVRMLNKKVNVHIFIDEGHWVLNSHQFKPDPEAQKLVLLNGHYCRSLNIISQRPGNVFKDYRSQVNFWFKFEKVWRFPLMFRKTIIEDMKDDMPDEDSEDNAYRFYFANKRVMRAYETHAMRGQDAINYMPAYEAYKTNFFQRLVILLSTMVPFNKKTK